MVRLNVWRLSIGGLSHIGRTFLRLNIGYIFAKSLCRGATIDEGSGNWNHAATISNTWYEAEVENRVNPSNTTVDIWREKGEATTFMTATRDYHDRIAVQRELTSNGTTNDNGSIGIVPIVGAVCGIAGILIGIIISAVAWVYIAKKRLRQQAAAIPKNPEEKTFERLDFNLTLPRQQASNNSTSSNSNHRSQQESTYLHFEEPTPSAVDESAEPQLAPPIGIIPTYEAQADGEFDEHDLRYQEPDDVQYRYPAPSAKYSGAQQHDLDQRLGHAGYAMLPKTDHQGVSYFGSTLNKYSSDQSTISKQSGSVAGGEGRRSSICTCRTDLPDTDSSNCSTCAGSLSLTSSLAREKPHGAYLGYRGHIHDAPRFSLNPRDILTFVEAPSSRKRISEGSAEMSSSSSSDSFTSCHDKSGYQVATQETGYEDENYAGANSLKYFDLQLPRSTFGSPPTDKAPMFADGRLERHPEISNTSKDELIFKSADHTIDL